MRKINGYTIIAATFDSRTGDYLILGATQTGSSGKFEYVSARVANPDTDTEWYWGSYHNDIRDAVAGMDRRLAR